MNKRLKGKFSIHAEDLACAGISIILGTLASPLSYTLAFLYVSYSYMRTIREAMISVFFILLCSLTRGILPAYSYALGFACYFVIMVMNQNLYQWMPYLTALLSAAFSVQQYGLHNTAVILPVLSFVLMQELFADYQWIQKGMLHNACMRGILLFTIGGTQGIEILEKLTREIRTYWPDFEGFITVYYEGVFSCYEEGDKGVSGINRALIDFYWKGGIVAPEFRRQTLSMQNPLFEKCTIYDGGARRYEIHEHIEEVLEFWNGILARADKIDKQALLEEKLGHALPISYEDWLKDCHYEKLDAKLTRWLYQQERGFVESLKDVTLEEIAHQRIDEFTTTLKKYIL